MMTEGELIQLTTIGKIDITENQYFDILRRKTAYLFSACCEIGAILSGASEDSVRRLRITVLTWVSRFSWRTTCWISLQTTQYSEKRPERTLSRGN